MEKWDWEIVDPGRSGSSGDVSKLFKNVHIKRPGVMAELNAEGNDATVLAREVVQNSWDSAIEAREIAERDDLPRAEFDLTFSFKSLDTKSTEDFRETCGISELEDRHSSVREQLSIPSESYLALRDGTMSLLHISESGTTGMYGNWQNAQSKMYLALVSVGFTQKADTAGGSYGYGKAGLIRASRMRTVIAYTCFHEQREDPGVTRRLLGMTYWAPHQLGEEKFTGFGRLGKQLEATTAPFENDEADEVAASLGISPRSTEGSGEDGVGTCFIVLDPGVEPRSLVSALEHNWWPAIVDAEDFYLTVVDFQGDKLHPKPRSQPRLQPFIRGFELARQKPDSLLVEEDRTTFQSMHVGSGRVSLGTLGLLADTDKQGWSYPSAADDVEHRSLVALVRGPRMVVEYYPAGIQRPYVRGTFLADPEIDSLLRETEPRAHDAWEHNTQDEAISVDATAVATAVLNRVKGNVNSFRQRLKPPKPDPREIRLPEFEKMFRHLIDGSGGGNDGPDQQIRMVLINVLRQVLEPDPDGAGIRMRSRFRFALSDHVKTEHAEVDIRVTYKFLEDGRAGDECGLTWILPEGIEVSEGQLSAVLDHHGIEVEVLSESYDADWSARCVAEANLVREIKTVTV